MERSRAAFFQHVSSSLGNIWLVNKAPHLGNGQQVQKKEVWCGGENGRSCGTKWVNREGSIEVQNQEPHYAESPSCLFVSISSSKLQKHFHSSDSAELHLINDESCYKYMHVVPGEMRPHRRSWIECVEFPNLFPSNEPKDDLYSCSSSFISPRRSLHFTWLCPWSSSYVMNDRAIRSTFQCSDTLLPLRRRWRKNCFTVRSDGDPDKDRADMESEALQQITTTRISSWNNVLLLHSLHELIILRKNMKKSKEGGSGALGVMGLEGIRVSLLCWAFIERLMDAL